MQTTFPSVHWFALSLLGISVIFGFLLYADLGAQTLDQQGTAPRAAPCSRVRAAPRGRASDQQTLLFLAPVQLRLLFSVLIGALTATACICADLNDPFRGAFQITPSSEQLFLIRDVVGRTLYCGDDEPVPPPPVLARYNPGSLDGWPGYDG